jgi:hypothetical protein
MTVLKRVIANHKDRFTANDKLHRADAEHSLVSFHRVDVRGDVMRQHLIIVTQEAYKLPLSHQRADVPRHGTYGLILHTVSPRVIDLDKLNAWPTPNHVTKLRIYITHHDVFHEVTRPVESLYRRSTAIQQKFLTTDLRRRDNTYDVH